jgi:glycine betaine/proline transport system permease protein
MTAVSVPAAARVDARLGRRIVAIALVVLTVVLWIVFRGQWTLPHDPDSGVFKAVNSARDWVDANRTVPVFTLFLDPIRVGIGALVSGFDALLATLGWPGVLAVAGSLGLIFGGLRLATLTVLGFASLGVLGLWTASMETLSLMLAAVIIALVIGIPLGIVAGRSQRFASFISPVLDVMQIMPTFCYLAPMTLLFFIGAPSATIVTLIYAIPPAIRITSFGIRGVAKETMEAAVSLGSTRWQVLRKVQLPLARRTIGVGINQTIMMALSMVVITALIGAPGLGKNVLQALQKGHVGEAFDAGIAIVILAIVLDRLTDRAGEWMDPRTRRVDDSVRRRRFLYGAVFAVSVSAIILAHTLPHPTVFPTDLSFSFREPIDAVVGWMKTNLYGLTSALKDATSNFLINPLEAVLTSAPWWLVMAVVVGIAWLISGLRSALIAGVCLVLLVVASLWEHSMQTLTTVLVATSVTLTIGIAFGIVSARSDRLRAFLRPILDAAQTMPAFVYLIPAVALFGASRFTAIVASVIYAAPPVIRLVDAGIRSVSPTVMEAATAAGSTERQLLWKVQLPLSRKALLLAVNQGIVLVLAMVVVGGLVGAGALGFDVVAGFAQRSNFGIGLVAGASIVLLGIMLDRISQGAGARPSKEVSAGG